MANLLIRDPFLAAPFRLMDELMRTAGNGGNRVTGFTPLVDVHETEEEYLVKVDLPGVKADDVNVEVNENVLSISENIVGQHMVLTVWYREDVPTKKPLNWLNDLDA